MGPADAAPSAEHLAKQIEEYLAEHPSAALMEDGRVVFDMTTAHYSVGESHGRCLLQLWSEERNLMRTVVEVQPRAQSLRLMTRRMGAARPQALELVPSGDHRTPTARTAARRNYLRLLERVLARHFPGSKVDGMRSAMDLEHSFGPAYTRGRLLRGTAAEAVIGVGESESTAMVEGVVTLGLLWLEYCREREARRHVGGLKVVVPAGRWRTVAERMAWLNHGAANFELYTLDERREELERVELGDLGNGESRLVHAFQPETALERCGAGVERLLGLIPPGARERIEVRARSAAEVGLLLHGLEIARVRHVAAAHSFAGQDEVSFGAGANETPLTAENEGLCRALLERLFRSRQPDGLGTDALYRMQPERWLEARLRQRLGELMPGVREDRVYSQVPALGTGERGMLDLLTVDQRGRLMVIELKAEEDLQLPMQALDYWMRVRALLVDSAEKDGRMACAFARMGYFAGVELSALPPRLVLAAPALRVHPATETVLKYLSPQVEWELIGFGEQWRKELKVVFRKRGSDPQK
ncbi:MAG TPA: hypothetical protein VMV57_10870 [Terracidiphilus sp.]|nr:hypothetical protein [Terracidiphilus sp.]